MTRKNKIAKLDKEWSRQVIERDQSICQKCGRWGENPHHVFYKRKLGSRWLLENGINLCEDCHVPWAHAKPEEFMEWWRYKVGEDVYFQILADSMRIKVDLNEAEKKLKESIYSKLTGGKAVQCSGVE